MTYRELIEEYNKGKIESNGKKLNGLLRNYKKNLKEIQKEIDSIYAQNLNDGKLEITAKRRIFALRELKTQLENIASDLGKEENELVNKILNDTAKESMLKTAYFTELGLNDVTSLTVVNDTIVKKILMTEIQGLVFGDRIDKNKDKLVDRVIIDVNRALIQGTDIKTLAKEIQKDFNISANESLRLIQTETARVMSEAQNEYYKENKQVIQKTRYTVTLDDKTSRICQDLEAGNDYITGECPIPVLDSHPRCRCVIVPVLEGWTPKTRWDNEKKQRVAYLTYSEWKKQRNI